LLRAKDRFVLRRIIYQFAPLEQVAKELGITPGAVAVRLHRAKKNLKKAYFEHFREHQRK
jgi:DNA-directed RNA polymerase specialized sigma24 family protein